MSKHHDVLSEISMSARGKRMVDMECQKDKMRLKQLEMKKPTWDNTKGVNLKDIDINKLKNVIFEPISKKTEHTNVVDFQNGHTNIGNKSINEKIVSTDLLHKHGITKDIVIHSNVLTPSIELKVAESYNNLVPSDEQPTMVARQSYLRNLQSAGTSHYNFDPDYKTNTTFYDSLVIPELTNRRPDEVIITELANVFPTRDNSNSHDSENDLFNDSGSEFVPQSVSSVDTSLGFSSDSNHNNFENSKEWAESNEFEQTRKTNTDSQQNFRQDERNNDVAIFNEFGEIKSSSSNLRGKLKRDKREHCAFCEKNVINFSRHLVRNHDKEFEVIKIISLPKNSKDRECLIDEI